MVVLELFCTFAKKKKDMIKCIIHCSDIHIRAKMRFDEYAEQLSKFIERCKEIASNYNPGEVRILISGDLLHQKNMLTPELIVFASSFIRQLEQIAPVVVIAGNHDLIVDNTDKKDALTSLFETAQFRNTRFLDLETEFNSGTLFDDNVTWVLYSIYQDYLVPDITKARELYPDNIRIGVFHGMINGCKLDNNTTSDRGVNKDIFIDCDMVMAGDIHKRQEMTTSTGVKIVYPGSLIQQDFGESISNHGFAVWDLENKTLTYEDLPSDYQLVNISIENEGDINENKEIITNI